MKHYISLLMLATAMGCQAQTFTIQTSTPRQTIQHFGASDAWSMQFIGLWDNEAEQQKIADWLFSTENDAQGQPRGIGLSVWRFNLGAGSAEQGDASQINPGTRTECFLKADGTYDWTKQPGQRKFLRMAKERGVPHFLAFLNSAPVYFTQNGLATNTGRGGTINLKNDCYDDFAKFMATAVKGIEEHDGIHFDYLCPVNEPDGHWNWLGPKQEGSPATNREIARLVRETGKAFKKQGLSTQIIVDESSDLRCMLATYMRKIREELRDTIAKYGLKFWQTELCIMGNDEEIGGGGGYDFSMKTALYVARVIHHDLVFADAESWSWWRSVGGDYKDGLIRVYSRDGMKSGYAVDSRLMWALGNYSRFIRPGAVRYEVSSSADFDPYGVMCSAYRNADGSWVVVAINYSEDLKPLSLGFSDASKAQWQMYRTSDVSGETLKPVGVTSGAVKLAPRSITTFLLPPISNL